jgi:hypothetical protein
MYKFFIPCATAPIYFGGTSDPPALGLIPYFPPAVVAFLCSVAEGPRKRSFFDLSEFSDDSEQDDDDCSDHGDHFDEQAERILDTSLSLVAKVGLVSHTCWVAIAGSMTFSAVYDAFR